MELADILVSEAKGRNPVRVQISPSAHGKNTTKSQDYSPWWFRGSGKKYDAPGMAGEDFDLRYGFSAARRRYARN